MPGRGEVEPLGDARPEAVADRPVGVQYYLAAALGRGRVRRRPVFHREIAVEREFQRLVMRLGREGDDQVKVLRHDVADLLGLVAENVEAELIHRRYREAVQLTGADAGRIHEHAAPAMVIRQCLGHGRTDGVEVAEKEHTAGCFCLRAGHGLGAQMEDADQRKQSPRSRQVELDLAGQAFLQQHRAVIMQPAPSHIDGLDA